MLYTYTAVDERGIMKEGEYDAPNKEAVLTFLARQNLVPISVKEKKAGAAAVKREVVLFQRVNLLDKIFFTKHLAIMLKAGVGVIEAMDILIFDTEKALLKKIYVSVKANLEKGRTLSSAFGDFPRHFSPLFISVISAGEKSGNLVEVLERLSVQMKTEYELKNRIRSAMIYPALLLTASFGIVVLLLTVVLPRLTKTFQETGIKLPAITQFLIDASNWVSAHIVGLSVFFGLFVAFLIFLWRTIFGQKLLTEIMFRAPIIKGLMKKMIFTRSLHTLAILLKSGIPILEALDITANSIGNIRYKEIFIKIAEEEVARGISLGSAFRHHEKLFPHLVSNMIGIGEKAGSLDVILETLSGFYDEEVDTALKTLVTLLEPILLIIMGVIVAFIALSVILPIYQIVGSFG